MAVGERPRPVTAQSAQKSSGADTTLRYMRMNRCVEPKHLEFHKFNNIFFSVRRVRCAPEWFACKGKWHIGHWWRWRKHLPHQLWLIVVSFAIPCVSHLPQTEFAHIEHGINGLCSHDWDVANTSLRLRGADSIQTNDWKLNTFAVASFFFSLFLFVSFRCSAIISIKASSRIVCMVWMLRLPDPTDQKKNEIHVNFDSG